MKIKKNRKLYRGNRFRVIQITGLRGILSAAFVVVCLAAGFVAFPSLVLYKLWNMLAGMTSGMPEINILQGLILWGIFAVSYIIANEKKKYLVAFEPKTVSGKDIAEIMREIKTKSSDFSEFSEISDDKNTKIKEENKDDSEKIEDKI